VWLRTGSHDRRCMPWQSWKMAARLQAAGSDKPVLLTTEPKVGHNYWWPAEKNFAFYFAHLGIEYQPPKTKAGKNQPQE
jgi:prolyl oligopeptidase PreP (S9A serine peptidase family)